MHIVDIEGLVAIIFVFLTPIFIVLIIALFTLKREQSKNRLIGKAFELGKEIDPVLLLGQVKQKKQNPERLLTSGVVLSALGLAAFGSLMLLAGFKWASLSSLLLFPGIGLLVVYALTRKNKPQ